MEKYEQFVVIDYFANLIRAARSRSPLGHVVEEWLEREGHVVALSLPAEEAEASNALSGTARRRSRRNTASGPSQKRLDEITELVEKRRRTLSTARPGSLERKLGWLGDYVGLNSLDLRILGLFLRYGFQRPVEVLWDMMMSALGCRSCLCYHPRAIAMLLGERSNSISARLDPGAPLMASGLVSLDLDNDIELLPALERLMQVSLRRKADLRRRLLGPEAKADLLWSDYDHIGEDRDHVQRVLRAALDNGATGINVLLYGAPGTGKTEFCKTMAKELGVPLFAVGEADDAGAEPTRAERLGALKLSQRLISGGEQALIMFDEIEDLFESGMGSLARLFGNSSRVGSKVFMHRLLEEMPVPMFWTTNDIECLGAAVLRRMTYSIEFRVPPARIRERVWEREIRKNRMQLPKEDISALAREFDAPPAIAASAVRSARMIDGDASDIRRAVRSIAKAYHSGRAKPPASTAAEGFDPALINADSDLAALADRVVAIGREASQSAGLSLCLFGPPGTGKSAYVRYLADRLAMEIDQRRTSDLLSPWVGETEQKIAAAFAEARNAGAFLVFDEADSLLGDRRGAQRSWEVSQVNEMLTWMESHPLPFACTTNLADHLDQASLRRFTFKVKLDYLRPDQADAAFQRFFDLEPPSGLGLLTNLTPGDFAVVQRKAALLGEEPEAATLLRQLEAECAVKPEAGRKIGF